MMKLAIPATGIIVGSGLCCCCGDFGNQFSDFGVDQNDFAVPEGTPDAVPAPDAGGGGSGDLCGRYGSLGVTVPSGLNVVACTDDGTNASLIMQGSGSPKDACTGLKSWGTGAGWNVVTEADLGGSYTVIMGKEGNNLTLACTDLTGSTTVSMTISPG